MSSQVLGALLTSRTPVSTQEWNELVASAVRERVAAALARVVEDDDNVPATTRRELAHELYNTGACNILLYRELARVLEANQTNRERRQPSC